LAAFFWRSQCTFDKLTLLLSQAGQRNVCILAKAIAEEVEGNWEFIIDAAYLSDGAFSPLYRFQNFLQSFSCLLLG
jgi:hypothetical protein